MASGPRLRLYNCKWVKVNNVKFTSATSEARRKVASNSVVAIELDDTQGNPAGHEFGRVQHFFLHEAPGGESCNHNEAAWPEWHCIADVTWFKRLSAAGQGLNKSINCPVVSKTASDDPNGSWWTVRGLVPTNFSLAPHASNDNVWQVLHIDSDFATRHY